MKLRGGIAGLALLLGMSSCLQVDRQDTCRENNYYAWGGEKKITGGSGPQMYIFDPTCGCFSAGNNILLRLEYGESEVDTKNANFDHNCYPKGTCLPDGRRVEKNTGSSFSATPYVYPGCPMSDVKPDAYEIKDVLETSDNYENKEVLDAYETADICLYKQGYFDEDKDGYGIGAPQLFCEVPDNYAVLSGDCNDNDPKIHPGAEELCDLLDNDCDGSTDKGVGGKILTKIINCGDDFKGEQTLVCKEGAWNPIGKCEYP